jgi:regulatory protein
MASNPYEYALNLLAARAYTVRNLRRKLAQKGFDSGEADKAVERLKARGYLDDDKFATEFARQRLVVTGASTRRVEHDLMRRGISAESAKAATKAIMAEENVDLSASMERLARKKLVSMGDLEPHVKRRRVFGFLARKGYELEAINRTLDSILP